jgi:uncharacterized protein (TIGR03435 family)
MQEVPDMELLRRYVHQNSEDAFGELVRRHVELVYSAALRKTGQPQDAEELTQAAFLLLAQKASRLHANTVLSGWLYQTVRLVAANFLRAKIQRLRREQEAVVNTIADEIESEVWPQIVPLLEDCMGKLGEKDRNAVLLRFFNGKSFREVGSELGLSENAARKRVNHALEKLRRLLHQRGVISTTAILADAFAAYSVQPAPAALAKSITVLTVGKGVVAGSSLATLTKATLKAMMWTKVKLAALAGLGILLASGTAIVADKAIRPANPAPAAQAIWDLYAKVFAQNLRGQAAFDAVTQAMAKHSPTASIRLSPVQRPIRVGGISGMRTPRGSVSMQAPLVMVLRYAYDLDPQFPQNRIVLPAGLEYNRYDYVDTMPQGGKEVLKRALKNQFGLVGRREMRKNLVLTVKNPAAGGLHNHTSDADAQAGQYRSSNITMAEMAKGLSKYLGVEVTDQTGLAGGFDYSLDVPYPPRADDLKKAVLDQFGLDLTPAADGQQFEFLVVEKVR